MKDEKGGSRAGAKNRKLYLYAALACATVLLAVVIVVTSVVLAGRKSKLSMEVDTPPVTVVPNPEQPDDEGNAPVVDIPEGFVSPVALVSVLNDYGFYHNATLNHYYEHKGVDFTAAVGDEVYAVDDGIIESVYTSDVLVGTQIVVDHGNGLKTVYEFVTAKEGLKAGDSVKKGDVIATVAEATGKEYKDGAHLHFEVLENGKTVDPAGYLTLEEK